MPMRGSMHSLKNGNRFGKIADTSPPGPLSPGRGEKGGAKIEKEI